MTGPCLAYAKTSQYVLDLSTFSLDGIASTKAPVASMLNHLTKRHREWPDRPHGMRIYDSIGGLRLRRTFEVFPCMPAEWPTRCGRNFEIFRDSSTALHMQA